MEEEVARDLKGTWDRQTKVPTTTAVQIFTLSCGLGMSPPQKQFSEDESPVEPYLGGSDQVKKALTSNTN